MSNFDGKNVQLKFVAVIQYHSSILSKYNNTSIAQARHNGNNPETVPFIWQACCQLHEILLLLLLLFLLLLLLFLLLLLLLLWLSPSLLLLSYNPYHHHYLHLHHHHLLLFLPLHLTSYTVLRGESYFQRTG